MEKKIQDRQFREAVITKDAVNIEARTVELAFSSEAPVERFFGMEILDHNPSSVRLGRLNDGGALLLGHDPDVQIGVVESVEIGSDRVGRAVVRFGKGDCADEIFQDVVDGIRRKVSVGYQIHNMILDSKTDAGDVYRVTDWEPLEISIVSIPADPSVGVGREIELQPKKEERTMTQATVQTTEPVVDAAATAAAIKEARNKELTRIRELETIGQNFAQFGGVELAREMIDNGKSVDDLNAVLLSRVHKKPTETGDIGMSEKEVRTYSFLRALNALANPNDKKAQEVAGFEREVSEAAVRASGKASGGFMIPVDVLRAPLIVPQKRTMTVGTGSAGGYTVATDLMSGSFIDLLRNKLALNECGATILNGLVGNIAVPRQTAAGTAYWVAEGGAPSASTPTLDQVTMSPKTVGAYTDLSRKLLLQSSVDVEALVRADLAKVIALAIDAKGLYGDGTSNTPTGIKNTSGINTKDFAAAAATYAEIVALETLVAAGNADVGTLAYLINARARGALKTTAINATYGDRMIWEPGNTVNGYRTVVSNQVAGTSGSTEDHFFGNWADLLIGFWSGLDLTVDPYTNSTTGTVRVVALQDADVGVRHAESFARGANTL